MAPSALSRLDFLRACAVLCVVASHLWFDQLPVARFGRFGVLLFFVHTSLVLMFSLERQVAANGNHRLWSIFMVRRVFRLYPLAVVVLLGVYFLRIPAYVIGNGQVHDFHPDQLGFVFNLLLVQEVFVSNAFFGSMMGVLWTLPVEMQMYLFLPLMYLVMRRLTDVRVLLLLWFVSALGAYGVPAVLDRVTGNGKLVEFGWGWIAFPRVVEFGPYFLGGVLAYALWRRWTTSVPFWAFASYLAFIAGTYLALLEIGVPGRLFFAWSVLSIGLGLGLLLPRVREPSSAPLRKVCATIATYSYGIYLTHVPCIWFGFDVLDNMPTVVQWAAFIGSLAAVCWALHRFVEQPGVGFGQRLARRLADTSQGKSPISVQA
jgi:peptidoglycan/LPS O-acetylase OafA/YrhL